MEQDKEQTLEGLVVFCNELAGRVEVRARQSRERNREYSPHDRRPRSGRSPRAWT